MRLSDYLAQSRKSPADLAADILTKLGIRVSQTTIWKIAIGKHRPRATTADAIVRATDGAVTLSDLVAAPQVAGLPPAPDRPARQAKKKTEPEVSAPIPIVTDDAAMVELPLLGYIAAGVPIKVQPGLEGSIYVDRTWVGSHPCFALRVTGDSMTGAGIMPHDIVVVRQANSALDGDIVVVTVDGETTLKRYRQKNGKILLVPENPTMAAIELTGGNVQIQGVVVGQIRSYHRPLDAKRTRSKR